MRTTKDIRKDLNKIQRAIEKCTEALSIKESSMAELQADLAVYSRNIEDLSYELMEREYDDGYVQLSEIINLLKPLDIDINVIKSLKEKACHKSKIVYNDTDDTQVVVLKKGPVGDFTIYEYNPLVDKDTKDVYDIRVTKHKFV